MASIKISGLTEQTTANDTDLLPVASSAGMAKRMTLANFVTWLRSKLGIDELNSNLEALVTLRVVTVSGKHFDLDNPPYTFMVYRGTDSGTNDGTSLPTPYVSLVLCVGEMQFGYSFNNSAVTRLYFRAKWGGWSEWIPLG